MAGRKRKPTKLHILNGTHRADRANPNEPEPDVCIPKAPEILEGPALDEWNRMSVELERLGLLTELDMAGLALYCYWWGVVVKFKKIIDKKGELTKTPNGKVEMSQAQRILADASTRVNKYSIEFGMTPASRSKVSAKDKGDKKKDPWEKFGNG